MSSYNFNDDYTTRTDTLRENIDNAFKNVDQGLDYSFDPSLSEYGYQELFKNLKILNDSIKNKNVVLKNFKDDAGKLMIDINNLINDIFSLINYLISIIVNFDGDIPEDVKEDLTGLIKTTNDKITSILVQVDKVDLSGLKQIIDGLVDIRTKLLNKSNQTKDYLRSRKINVNNFPENALMYREGKHYTNYSSGGRHHKRTTRKRSSRRKTMDGAKHKKRRSTRRHRKR